MNSLTGLHGEGRRVRSITHAELSYYDANGSAISTSDSGPLGSSGSTWKAFTLSAHSPANAAKMAIFLTEEAGAGQVVYFDGVRLKIPGLVGKYDFTGKKTDDESGLTYFGARFYDAEVGRFVTQDPAKDGENWFGYCSNNPLRNIDPTGLDDEDVNDPSSKSQNDGSDDDSQKDDGKGSKDIDKDPDPDFGKHTDKEIQQAIANFINSLNRSMEQQIQNIQGIMDNLNDKGLGIGNGKDYDNPNNNIGSIMDSISKTMFGPDNPLGKYEACDWKGGMTEHVINWVSVGHGVYVSCWAMIGFTIGNLGTPLCAGLGTIGGTFVGEASWECIIGDGKTK